MQPAVVEEGIAGGELDVANGTAHRLLWLVRLPVGHQVCGLSKAATAVLA